MAAVNDYIFLRQKDFLKQRGNNFVKLIAETKTDILKNAIKQQTKRQEMRFSEISGEDMQNLHDILHSEELIKKLNASVLDSSPIDMAFPGAREAIAKLVPEIKSIGQNAQEVKEKIDEVLNTFDKYNPTIRDAYYKAIKYQFIARNTTGVKKSWGKTEEERIYESIMSSTYKGKIFWYPLGTESREGINQSLLRLYMLRGLLDSDFVKDNENFWNSIGDKINDWMGDIKDMLTEWAILKAYVKGESDFFSALENSLHVNLQNATLSGSQTSGVGVDIERRFSKDGEFGEWYEELKKYRMDELKLDKREAGSIYNVKNNKTNVSDIQIRSSDSSIEGIVGITIKDYEQISFNNEGHLINIHIQDNTPLLTLLTREANLTPSELITLINMGATLPAFGENDLLYGSWNAFKETIPYRATLAALAGFDGANDQAFYMSLNGRIFTIQQVLSSMLEVVTSKRVAAHATISGHGLDRDYLQLINAQSYVDISDNFKTPREAAEERSKKTKLAVMNEFYNTKVAISISLANLSQYISG